MNDTTTDPAAELEARVMAGEDVTEAEAVAAFTAADARGRLAELRQRRAERQAAEETERDHARRRAAALEHARTALARSSPQQVAQAYDAAVAGIAALVDVVADRNATLGEIAGAAEPDRIPDAEQSINGRASVRLDGQGWRMLDLHPLLEAACRRAGAVTANHDGRFVPANRSERQYAAQRGEPAIVQAGRPTPPAA